MSSQPKEQRAERVATVLTRLFESHATRQQNKKTKQKTTGMREFAEWRGKGGATGLLGGGKDA